MIHPSITPWSSIIVPRLGNSRYLLLNDPLYFFFTPFWISWSWHFIWKRNKVWRHFFFFIRVCSARLIIMIIIIMLIAFGKGSFFLLCNEYILRKSKNAKGEGDIKFSFGENSGRKGGLRGINFPRARKWPLVSYPSRYLTPFWNSARAEINRERNVSRKIRDVTRTRSTAFPCFVFELEQGLCLWVILFRIERAHDAQL